MLVKGSWEEFSDGAIRPVVYAFVQTAAGDWRRIAFLLDAGADRTILHADLLPLLAPLLLLPDEQAPRLGGIGGEVGSRLVQTSLAFTRDDGKRVTVNGTFSVFVVPESSDVSILGRDVTDNFDVIYSRPKREVLLLAPPHGYTVQLPF